MRKSTDVQRGVAVRRMVVAGGAAISLFGAAFLAPISAARADDAAGAIVELRNVHLWVKDSGGAGVPVILLHANTGTIENWENQTAAFVAAGYRVIAFDRPGWGKSVVREGQKPIPVAEDLDELVEKLKLDKFHLVSVAGGGYIAMDYAVWKPERVRSLVVAASGLGLKGDDEGTKFRANAAIPGFEKLPPEVREMSPTYRGLHPDGVKRWKEIEEHAMQANAIDPPLRSLNTVEKVESVTTPILVMAGDVDLTTPSGAVRLWSKHLKSYDWALLTESGHSIAWEQPEAFNKTVLEFLKKH